MEETTFAADPMRLMIAAAVGIIVLLVLIIKFKLHPVLSMMISAIIIGAGAGMPLTMISDTVEKGVGKTLQGIALLVGLGSMFGGILEVSGGAQRIAETLIHKFGQKKAGWALGLTGLVIGTTVFFEAGVVVLIPLAFSVAKQTKKSTLYYAIPLLSGLASGYAFVPPSAGSVLVANALGVNLGTMIMVGIPTALICMLVSGIIWGGFIGNKIFTELPANVGEIKDDGKELPSFGLVLGVILIPLVLILLSTLSKYMPLPAGIQDVLGFLGKPFLALGLTGLVIGTTVFFEAGVVVLIPLAFSVAKQTKKSTLYYAIPLLSGLASGYAFVPPSAGSVLVANALGVNLGTMIMVGIPTALICMLVSGIIWGGFIGNKIFTELPANVGEIKDDGKELPSFGLVLGVILIPLVLILLSTLSKYMPLPAGIQDVLGFLGKPFLALTIATLAAMYFLGIRRGFSGAQLKKILDHSLRPVGMILLVIASGGVIRWMLQDSGLGNIIGPALEKSGLPLILIAFFIAILVRASVGSSIVAMTMASGIMATMPAVMDTSMLYRAAMCCAICGGATALSHVNDAGFWLVGTFLEIDEKTTLKSWTIMETLIGVTALIVSLVISIFA